MNGKNIGFAGLMLMLTALTPLFSQPCDCLTTGNCPVSIQDNGTFQGTLDVTVNGPNDLAACPLTSICFQITHTWVGDLSVTLTSPGGLNYMVMADVNNNWGGCGTQEDNIDVCIFPGGGFPLTNNTEYICNTGPCPSGTCCLTGVWTMPCGGVTDPITNAQQAPNCDLNDFNLPGQPANGTWTLTVNDICSQDVGTLDNFTLTFACGTQSCIVCEADGGSLNAPAASGCFGDPSLNLSLPPQYNGGPPNPGEYAYAYVITQNDIILAVNPTADMTTQPAGMYQVCGLSYSITATGQISSLIGMNYSTAVTLLESSTAPFCADLSSDCVSVTIGPPIPPTILDTLLCLGDCITVGGQEMCSSGMVTLPSYLGCDSVINVIIIPIFVTPTVETITVCQGDCITINNQTYCPPGPHVLIYQSWQGCDSLVSLTLLEEITAVVINPPNPPPLTCTNQSVTLDGTLSVPATVTYAWAGPGGFNSTLPSVTVSSPGSYTLTITNSNLTPPCTATASIMVVDSSAGPNLQVNGPPPAICNGDSLDLATLDIQDLNNTNPTITFHSDTPATPANELPSTLVSPDSTTTYYILGDTGDCSDEISVTLTVNALPLAGISADSTICLDTTATVVYTGDTATIATYSWNFSGGTATPGTGAGPHTLSWATSGTKIISIVVQDSNGCSSLPVSDTVQVDAPLNAPVINCTPSTGSIEFTWNNVANASGYNVTVAIGPQGILTSGTSYLITGLNANEQASIIVEAIAGNACGNVSTQITCTAQDCATVTVAIGPVPDICLDSTAAPFLLTASATGGLGGGAFTWSGSPAVNALTGMFNPALANAGPNTIIVTYEEGTCLYNASATIYVYPQPTADFTVTSPICVNANSTINYTGNAGAGGTYTWNFDGGTANPGIGPGPHSVSWAVGGTYTVSLMVDENNCPSETATQTVQVDEVMAAPQISCNVTTGSVEFIWNNVPGATGYNVTLLNGPAGTQPTDTTYLVTGLSPGDAVSIEVVAIGTGACGNSTAQQTCTASDCPPVTIGITSVGPLCLTASTAPFDLMATVNGGTGSGTLTWSGNGITDAAAGTFDPNSAAFGGNTVTATYTEGNCIFTETTVVSVFPTPEASFTEQSPVCTGDISIITYTGTALPGLIYNWDFGSGTASPGTGAGPHDVSWGSGGLQPISLSLESPNGCISSPFTAEVQVDEPLTPPAVGCNATTSNLSFTWPDVAGATNYDVTVLDGSAGVLNPNSYLVNGLVPGDSVTIELTVSNNGACPPVTVQQTCYALDCADITIQIDSVLPLCLGIVAPFDLSATVSGGNNTGTGTWSGTGITNAATGTFAPAVAGTGPHTLTYTFVEDGCTFNASTTIDINAEPTATFVADLNICISDAATVTYTGTATGSATYTWDFDGGTAIPGTGAGPHSVTWANGGSHTIALTVTENGCTSAAFLENVNVDEVLATPVIDCSVTSESVEFSWADIVGATGYDVAVLSGPAGISPTATSYLVTGLSPGDAITIQVTANGNTICPVPVAEMTCSALDCPPVVIDITPVAPICLNAAAAPVDLEVTLTGDTGTGTGSWSGNGIAGPNTPVFDPVAAGMGFHTLTYTYAEGNCVFSESITVEVSPPPVADAGSDATLTCKEGESSVQLGGTNTSAGGNIVHLWSAATGAFPGDSTLLHPNVSLAGTYTLTVTDTVAGCVETDDVVVVASQDVPVPVLSIKPISCFGENDGAIEIISVSGGESPYLFSLNGSPFTQTSAYPFLTPGVYELQVIDINGCENMLTIDLQQPQELSVQLIAYIEGDNIIHLGDSAQLEALVTLPEDSLDLVQWQPDSLVSCDTCLDPVATPVQTTTFSVTVESNGCTDSDQMTLFVRKDRQIYVPNAFSPNNDGRNDFFEIYAGPQVASIKSFLVFNRWGESVWKYLDFLPGDPAGSWNGMFRNRVMNPAVFTWFAEIEFVDGSTELFEGDVTLVK
jgi:gliding motility-associated-like protein